MAAPPVSPSAITTTATRTTARGGRLRFDPSRSPKLRDISTGYRVCHDAAPVARLARANGSHLRCRLAGWPCGLPRRRAGQGRHEPPGVRRADSPHRRDLRPRSLGGGRPRADLRRSRDGKASQPHVARAALRRGPRRSAARAPLLGGAVVWADGSHPRPRRVRAHRVRGLAPALRPGRRAVRRQRRALLRARARRGPLSHLRDRPAPGGSLRARPPPPGALPPPRRRQRDRRRNRRARGPGDRDVRDDGRLALPLLHHAARRGRRGLRDLALHADERRGTPALPAPSVRDGGAERAALCAAFGAIVRAAERFPLISEGGARPHPQYIYAGMALQRRLIVDMMRTLRELAGGAFQTVPSSEAAFTSEETRANTERYYKSTAAAARERVKLVKLVWDFVGTEFGGRQLQYEMFYSAAQPVVNRRMFRSYDWQAAKALVDRCLGEY